MTKGGHTPVLAALEQRQAEERQSEKRQAQLLHAPREAAAQRSARAWATPKNVIHLRRMPNQRPGRRALSAATCTNPNEIAPARTKHKEIADVRT